ncbi:hypothetical protein, partial [Aggregatibacter actinomycetemcomitans]|uniref:hypothetical protein n=1 Tax=Aggregatibacter actinomycetemcomitans TaxID=714 RepID=UPI001E4DCA4D
FFAAAFGSHSSQWRHSTKIKFHFKIFFEIIFQLCDLLLIFEIKLHSLFKNDFFTLECKLSCNSNIPYSLFVTTGV